MKTFLMIIFSTSIILGESAKSNLSNIKSKRGVSHYGQHVPNFNFFNDIPTFRQQFLHPTDVTSSLWDSDVMSDLSLGQLQLQATHNLAFQGLRDSHRSAPAIVYSPDVIRAVQFAKEANNNVHIAQQRVDGAKEAAIVQQKIALAKEAVAREAAHRSAEIAAHAEAEARASATQLVGLQQRLATLKDAVAAAQRVAAARETAAAAAIQRSAADTAAELRKQDVDIQISQSEREAKARDLIAAKENEISNALRNNIEPKRAPLHHPWG